MNLRSEKLERKLAVNQRRLNRDKTREKLKAAGLIGKLGDEGSYENFAKIVSFPPIEDIYVKGWRAALEKLHALPIGYENPILFAPFDTEKYGIAFVNTVSLLEFLNDDPLKFDRDGFWISGQFGAALVDFDFDHLDSEILWQRYTPVRSQINAKD